MDFHYCGGLICVEERFWTKRTRFNRRATVHSHAIYWLLRREIVVREQADLLGHG
jgi:hypothetical protein